MTAVRFKQAVALAFRLTGQCFLLDISSMVTDWKINNQTKYDKRRWQSVKLYGMGYQCNAFASGDIIKTGVEMISEEK